MGDAGNEGLDPLEHMRLREEILQAVFWMRGEGLAEAPTRTMLASFLAEDQLALASALERLVSVGDLAHANGGYVMTERSLGDAAQLFGRDFAEMVNASAHGTECSRPDCDCHALGPEECATRDDVAHDHAP